MNEDRMEGKATQKHLRRSPRKVRLVVDNVRGDIVEDAVKKLKFTNKAAAKPVAKVIKSAAANMRDKYQEQRFDDEELVIDEIYVNEGSTLKRMQPRAMGRANVIRKKTCHIHVTVTEQQALINQ